MTITSTSALDTGDTRNETMVAECFGSPATPAQEILESEIIDAGERRNTAQDAVFPGQRSSFKLTSNALFRLALSLSAFDPSRMMLGLFYESKLRRECAVTLNGPIRSNDFAGIWKAIRRRRLTPEFFQCTAIDIVLMNLLKTASTNHDYSRRHCNG